jgi:hypothetical protein
MSDLERALDEFRAAMLAKFHLPRVVARWGPTSVTLDGNLDRMVDADVWSHYQEEFVERMKARTEADRAAEDIDVANLAFLSWYANSRTARFQRHAAVRGDEFDPPGSDEVGACRR